MADVVSRISSLPDSYHPTSEFCDNHPNVPATVRVQGETDSFGAEMIDLCRQCHERYLRQKKKAVVEKEPCDWCSSVRKLRNTRDFEEGLFGRVYRVCTPCFEEQGRRAMECDPCEDESYD